MDRVGGKRASRRSRCQEPETAVPVGRGGEVAGSPRVPWDPRPGHAPSSRLSSSRGAQDPLQLTSRLGPPCSPPRAQAPWPSSPWASPSTCPPRALRMFSPGLAMVPPPSQPLRSPHLLPPALTLMAAPHSPPHAPQGTVPPPASLSPGRGLWFLLARGQVASSWRFSNPSEAACP